jgi:hypothetical protein
VTGMSTSSPMPVGVLLGLPGSGKSHRFIQEVVATPGFYIFFSPIIALIKEQVAALKRAAPDAIIIQVHSGVRGRRPRNQAGLDDARASVEGSPHFRVVIFMTHDALLTCDFSKFGNWHFRIDEAPNAVQSGMINIGQSAAYFSATFDLDAAGDWSLLKPRAALGNWREAAADALLSKEVNFLKAVQRSGGVFVNIRDWREAKSFEWCAVWTPYFLRHTSSVKIAGASFMDSLGCLATKKWWSKEVVFQDQTTERPRTGFPSISIRYFTQAHEGTTKLWEESVGRKHIKAVCDYLTEREPSLGFWSGNEMVRWLMEHRLNGDPPDPKQAGINKFEFEESCAFIYSSKPLEGDGPLRSLFGITNEQILAARETEDIFQFVFRGAIRRPEFDGAYRIYLYTRRQAEALKARIDATGIAASVVLEPVVEVGIMNVILPRLRETSVHAPKALPTRIMHKGRSILVKSEKRRLQRAAKKSAQAPDCPTKDNDDLS